MQNNEKDPIESSEDEILDTNGSAADAEVESATDFEKDSHLNNEPTPINYEAKIAELNDKYLRLYSEFDNYRKRTIKEKSDIIRSAGEDVFKVFIPTVDDFERAIKANETVEEAGPIKEGIPKNTPDGIKCVLYFLPST